MLRLATFFFALFLSYSIALNSFSDQKSIIQEQRVNDKIAQLERQYDSLQKYIFNLQYTKGGKEDGSNVDITQLTDQMRLLRKEIEELKKEMDLLRININNYSDNIDKKVIELQNKIDEREYNTKFLDIIDSELNAYSNLKGSNIEQKKEFTDTAKLKEEEKKYDSIMNLINSKNYEQANRELKKFIVWHPNSILAPNVFFYLGEIAFKQKNYTTAAINYFKGYQINRRGEKSLSNLIMLSRSMIKIGKYTTACKVIQHIEYNFSDIPALIKRQVIDMKNLAHCNN